MTVAYYIILGKTMIKMKANVNQKLKGYSTFFGNHFTTPPELNKSWVLPFSLKNISNQTVLVPLTSIVCFPIPWKSIGPEVILGGCYDVTRWLSHIRL